MKNETWAGTQISKGEHCHVDTVIIVISILDTYREKHLKLKCKGSHDFV